MLSAPPYPPRRRKVAAREESARFGSGGEDSRPCHASPALQFPRLNGTTERHRQRPALLAQVHVNPSRPRPLGRARMRRAGAPFTTPRWRRLAVVAEPSELRVSGGAEGVTGEPAGGVAMSHGHSHGGGGCRCAAEREEPPEQRGLAYGLYLRIDLERLQCLNESREGRGRGVFKPWEERTDRSKVGGPGAPGPRRVDRQGN